MDLSPKLPPEFHKPNKTRTEKEHGGALGDKRGDWCEGIKQGALLPQSD